MTPEAIEEVRQTCEQDQKDRKEREDRDSRWSRIERFLRLSVQLMEHLRGVEQVVMMVKAAPPGGNTSKLDQIMADLVQLANETPNVK